MAELSQMQRGRIVGLVEAGFSMQATAERVGTVKSTVSKWWNCDLNPLEHWDTLKRKANKGIKPDTTLEGLRRILLRKWRDIDQGKIRHLVHILFRACDDESRQ